MAVPGPVENDPWRMLLDQQFRENKRLFYRLAFGVLRDHESTEDACQQGLLKAWQSRPDLENQLAARKWLSRVILNESLQLRRRNGTEQRVLANHSQTLSDYKDPVAERDRHDAILAAIEKLPEPVRTVVAYRLMQGVSGNEVKELLGCSAAEVSRHLHRGIELLRGSLAEWQPA